MTINGSPRQSVSPAVMQMQLSDLRAKLKEAKATANDEAKDDKARDAARAEVARLGLALADLQMPARYFG